MPNVYEGTAGPKTKVFGQLCLLFLAAGAIISVVTKSLWPLLLFAVAIYLVAVFTNREERRETAEDNAPGSRRGRPRR